MALVAYNLTGQPKPKQRAPREPYCKIIRTDAGWHAVIVAANHQPVFTTEVYTRYSAAERAVDLVKWSVRFGPTRHLDERSPR